MLLNLNLNLLKNQLPQNQRLQRLHQLQLKYLLHLLLQ
jgi:hypothetical protein